MKNPVDNASELSTFNISQEPTPNTTTYNLSFLTSRNSRFKKVYMHDLREMVVETPTMEYIMFWTQHF